MKFKNTVDVYDGNVTCLSKIEEIPVKEYDGISFLNYFFLNIISRIIHTGEIPFHHLNEQILIYKINNLLCRIKYSIYDNKNIPVISSDHPINFYIRANYQTYLKIKNALKKQCKNIIQ